MVGGGRNGALVVQKRAASGERRLMRVRERPAVKECEKAWKRQRKMFISGNRTPALRKKNLPIHHTGYD